MNGEKDKVVTVDKNGILTMENSDKFTKKDKKILNDLSENERRYLRKACREVFHNNAAVALPKLKARYLGGAFAGLIATITSNSVDEVCSRDFYNQLSDVCE